MRRLPQATVVALLTLCALPLSGAKHDSWVEVRSPNFIVVSNAGEKQARKTALQFEQIREVFRQSLAVASSHPSPVITILAVKDEQSMRDLLPEYWAKGHAHLAGLFIYRMNIYFAAVQLDEESEGALETFYHEYYHSVTMPYFPELPLWLAEGLAEFYGHTKIDDKSVGMGEADATLVTELRHEPLIPLNTLFKVDQSSPYYNESNKTSIFYAESWALTHYLMVGDRAAHRPMLLAYLKAIEQGKSSDQAAVEAFGDLKKLESTLMSYLNGAAFFYMKVPSVPKVSDADLKTRPLSDAEADAYHGGFETIRGRTQDAEKVLEEAIKTDPKCALAYEYLGLSQFFDGHRDEAIASLSKSISADPKNSFTLFMRAQLALSGNGMPSDDSQSQDDLRQAIALSSNFASPYALLAVYMARHDDDLQQALTLAQKAVSFEPGNSNYLLALAQVLARMEKFDDAKAAALKAAGSARQPQEQAYARSFLTYLQQAKNQGARVARSGTDEDEDREQDEGTVSNVSCENGLKIDLNTAGTIVHLRSSKTQRLMITGEEKLPENFNPCQALSGLTIVVQYHPDENDRNSGEIRSLRILGTADKTTQAKPGTATAEGKVADITCKQNDMLLKLAVAEDKFVVLHAADYTKISYLAGANSSLGDMDPCSQMKGRNVRITYAETQQQKFAGEMQTIVVGK